MQRRQTTDNNSPPCSTRVSRGVLLLISLGVLLEITLLSRAINAHNRIQQINNNLISNGNCSPFLNCIFPYYRDIKQPYLLDECKPSCQEREAAEEEKASNINSMLYLALLMSVFGTCASKLIGYLRREENRATTLAQIYPPIRAPLPNQHPTALEEEKISVATEEVTLLTQQVSSPNVSPHNSRRLSLWQTESKPLLTTNSQADEAKTKPTNLSI